MRVALNAEQIAVWKFIARIAFRIVGIFFVKSDRLLATVPSADCVLRHADSNVALAIAARLQ